MSVTNPVLFEIFDTVERLYQPRDGPRQRGRPPSYQEVAMLKAFVLMVGKRLKTFSGLWSYLRQHPEVARRCGFQQLPHRSTFSRRLKAISPYAFSTGRSVGEILASL